MTLLISAFSDYSSKYFVFLLDFSNKPHDSQLTFDMGCDQARTAISPFVCLSGNTDFDLLHTGTANHVSAEGL